MTVVRVAIVDDHRVVAAAVRAYLESFADIEVVGTATSGEQALVHVDAWRADVVLQDLLLPGGLDGIATTSRLLARQPSLGVVALTASTDEARMMGVLRVGARGYVRKDAEPETLLAAVRAVALGRTFIDPAVAKHVTSETTAVDALTPRETEVLRWVALGRSNREIAASLDVGDETVKTHVSHVLAKLGVENRGQAAVAALKRGLVTFEDLS